jgi:hypothetical protein
MGEGKPRTPRRRVRHGGWRRGHFRRIDDSSRGDAGGALFFGGLETLGLLGLVDALERRRAPTWIVAAVLFLAGVWMASAMFVGGEEGIGSLGWMGWGAVGAMLGAGLWLAAVPYRGRGPARTLRACAVVAALSPIALHMLGAI